MQSVLHNLATGEYKILTVFAHVKMFQNQVAHKVLIHQLVNVSKPCYALHHLGAVALELITSPCYANALRFPTIPNQIEDNQN